MKIGRRRGRQPRPGCASVRAFEDSRAANRIEVEEAFTVFQTPPEAAATVWASSVS